MRRKLLLLEPDGYAEEALSILDTLGERVNGPFTRTELLQAVAGAHALIVRLGHRLDEALLAQAPRLQVVVSATTGLDHIDLAAAEKHGLTVLSLAQERRFLDTVTSTAEHAWALLLALLRNLPEAHGDAISGNWRRDQFRGHELQGMRLGILGCGRLGGMVANYGHAFGMAIAACDPYASNLPPHVIRVGIDELFTHNEIISIHLPLTGETRKLVGARLLQSMPKPSFLINTSRGQIIDEAALLDALVSGQLTGAALDVLDGEHQGLGTVAGHPLVAYARTHGNCIITPHVGGCTCEAMNKAEVFMAKRLQDFFAPPARRGKRLARGNRHADT